MDENTGQVPVPQVPLPQTPPPAQYEQPAPSYAPAPPARAERPTRPKKTWLWILLALVFVGLLGCCAASALGGLALFSFASAPADSIEAINQAALDGDSAQFEKYFDAQSVTRNAYDGFLEYVKGTEDYQTIVEELGEEEADRILREDVLPEDQFVEELSAEFAMEGISSGEVPFPEYTVTSNSIENDEAQLTIVTIEEGEEVTYDLVLVRESYDGEMIWRLKEIQNIADLIGAEEALE